MGAQLWTICAGKGGVGKTFITSSLAITLSKLNFKVLVIDLDITGANLHSAFGVPLNDHNLRKYFSDNAPLSSLVTPCRIPRTYMIQGFWDNWLPIEIHLDKMHQFIQDVKKLDYDYVLVDLGAGAQSLYLPVIEQSDEKFLITSPEPSSIEKTYRFVESWIFYRLHQNGTTDSIKNLETTLREYRKINHNTPFCFRSYLREASGFTFDHLDTINEKPFQLLLNETRSQQDHDLGYSIRSICNKYYDLKIDFLGSIDFDNAVWQSSRGREPVLISKPFTPLAGQFLQICKTKTQSNFHAHFLKEVV